METVARGTSEELIEALLSELSLERQRHAATERQLEGAEAAARAAAATAAAATATNASASPQECGMCLDKPVDCVFDCGHLCCFDCAEMIDNCHICRQPITKRKKVYL